MSNPMPGPPPIRDGETWEDYVYRCRRPGETIHQAEARLIEARLLEAGATPPEPTTCTCEGDVEWNEGIPHRTPITRDCPEHQEDDQVTALPAINTLTPAHVGLTIRIQDAGLDVTGTLVRLEADSAEDQPMLGVAPRHVPLAPETTLAVAGGTVTVRLNPTTTVELKETP